MTALTIIIAVVLIIATLVVYEEAQRRKERERFDLALRRGSAGIGEQYPGFDAEAAMRFNLAEATRINTEFLANWKQSDARPIDVLSGAVRKADMRRIQRQLQGRRF